MFSIGGRVTEFGARSTELPIFLDDVSCSGLENNLIECSHSEIGINDCIHEQDVGIVCSDGETMFQCIV